jgi:hypothetical protein
VETQMETTDSTVEQGLEVAPKRTGNSRDGNDERATAAVTQCGY